MGEEEENSGKKNGGVEDGRKGLLQRPLLLYLRLLSYGDWINRAVSSMTNGNKTLSPAPLHSCFLPEFSSSSPTPPLYTPATQATR